MEVNATFEQISQLLNDENYTEFSSAPKLHHLTSDGNIIFTIVDKSGKRFIAEVYYNSEDKSLSPSLMQQVSYLIGLPPSILMEIVVKMNLQDVLRICQSNKYLNQSICENDTFWKQKFIHDFDTKDIKEDTLIEIPNYWKQRYQNFGRVRSFGGNEFGQLGLGDHGDGKNRDRPTPVTGVPPAVSVVAGHFHSLLLDVRGRVWSFGNNLFGQLGLGNHGDETIRDTPTLIPTLETGVPPVVSVTVGDYHSLLLDDRGGVWSFGSNSSGQLGLGNHGDGTDRDIPTLITGIPPVVSVSAGYAYSLLLDVNGGVWSFGNNYSGKLGLGDHGEGMDRDIPTLITGIPPVVSVAAGHAHSLLLDVNGGVWSFGNNYSGRLGLGDHGRVTNRDTPTLITGIPSVVSIAAGYTHSLLLDVNGGVWSFGNNIFGQLGRGDHEDIPTLITGIPPVVSIATGRYYSLLLDDRGGVWSFGYNISGQLGLGNHGNGTDRGTPTLIVGVPPVVSVAAGSAHSFLISN